MMVIITIGIRDAAPSGGAELFFSHGQFDDATDNEIGIAQFIEKLIDATAKKFDESKPTDESKQSNGIVGSPVGELSEREYQLKQGNPYDASGLPKRGVNQ